SRHRPSSRSRRPPRRPTRIPSSTTSPRPPRTKIHRSQRPMRDRPHPNHKLEWPGGVVPEWARPQQNGKQRFGRKGPGGKAGEKGGGKRERLQKVMAQSGHGSRRNIEILIAQGHLTINGQVAKL